jgi:hypothetical protein
MAMFTVLWVVHGHEANPIETETFRVSHADILVTFLPLSNGNDAAKASQDAAGPVHRYRPRRQGNWALDRFGGAAIVQRGANEAARQNGQAMSFDAAECE